MNYKNDKLLVHLHYWYYF